MDESPDDGAGAAAGIPNGGGAEGEASPIGSREDEDAVPKASADPGGSVGEGHTRVTGGGAPDVAATPPGVVYETDLDGTVFDWEVEGGTPHRVMDRYALILLDAHAAQVKVDAEGAMEDDEEAVGDGKKAVGYRMEAVAGVKEAVEDGKVAGDGKGSTANGGTHGGDPMSDGAVGSGLDGAGDNGGIGVGTASGGDGAGTCSGGDGAGVSASIADNLAGGPPPSDINTGDAPSSSPSLGFIGLDAYPPKAHPASNGRALHGRGVVMDKTVVPVDPTPTGPLAVVLEGIALPASPTDGLPVRLRTGRVVDWSIDYGPTPAIWIRTTAAWYRLTDTPATAYAAISRLSRLRLALATRAYALAHPVSAARAAADVTADRVIQSLVSRRRGGWTADEIVAEAPW
eukprot:contig_31190_g7617